MSSLSATALTAAWSRARLMGALFAAQVCGSTGHSMSLAVGGILAAQITGSNASSGLPGAVGAPGAALASWPLARLMGHAGRRVGLVVGYGLAVLGAQLCMVGVVVRSFSLLLVGMALFGISNTSNLLARYAAADVSTAAQRGRAMGLIVWGGAAGSIIGPNLMGPFALVGEPLGLSPAGSAFLISITAFALALIITQALLRPDPLAIARQLHERASAAVPDAKRSL